eukprot:7748208-Alexandrium_andersonii.AAC.1
MAVAALAYEVRQLVLARRGYQRGRAHRVCGAQCLAAAHYLAAALESAELVKRCWRWPNGMDLGAR